MNACSLRWVQQAWASFVKIFRSVTVGKQGYNTQDKTRQEAHSDRQLATTVTYGKLVLLRFHHNASSSSSSSQYGSGSESTTTTTIINNNNEINIHTNTNTNTTTIHLTSNSGTTTTAEAAAAAAAAKSLDYPHQQRQFRSWLSHRSF